MFPPTGTDNARESASTDTTIFFGTYDIAINYQHIHLLHIFRVLHPLTGRVLEVYSNQPGMQFYTGNLLPDPNKIVEVSSAISFSVLRIRLIRFFF